LSQLGREILLAREAKQFAFHNALTDVVGWVGEISLVGWATQFA
jgi:hypothetical protein